MSDIHYIRIKARNIEIVTMLTIYHGAPYYMEMPTLTA